MIPTPQEARSRQTAMEAERHWFTSRLAELAAQWLQEADYHEVELGEALMGSVLRSCAADLTTLAEQRTR